MKLRPSMASSEVGEEDDVADRGLVGNDGGEAVDPQPHATGWREAVLERGEEVFVHRMRLLIPGGAGARLVNEPGSLVVRVVELGEGIRDLLAGDEELEAIRQSRVRRAAPCQR